MLILIDIPYLVMYKQVCSVVKLMSPLSMRGSQLDLFGGIYFSDECLFVIQVKHCLRSAKS